MQRPERAHSIEIPEDHAGPEVLGDAVEGVRAVADEDALDAERCHRSYEGLEAEPDGNPGEHQGPVALGGAGPGAEKQRG